MHIFQEEQRFTSLWLWVPLIAITLILLISLTPITYKSLVGEGKNIKLGIALLIGMVINISVVILIYSAKLTVEVTDKDLKFKLVPLVNKTISLNEIVDAQLIEFNAIKDFGGYGIRMGKIGKGYIIKGNKGVKIISKDDGTFVLGSQRSRELLDKLFIQN